MAIPKNPNKKDKGSTKKRIINEEGRGPDDNYDQVFQLAVKQEEQGERYQFGAKAQRNYELSMKNYQFSIQLLQQSSSSSSEDFFNSHFNLARVLIHFGTTFGTARSQCVKFVKDGINQYRQAVGFAISSSNPSDEIDGRYNLGLGLSSLAEMLSAGAMDDDQSSSCDYRAMANGLWKDAKEELLRAYQLQEAGLADSPYPGHDQVDQGGVDEAIDQVDQDASQNDPSPLADSRTVVAEEIFVITPSVLIDTLMDICEILLSLYPSEPEATSTELAHYVQQLGKVNHLIENSSCPQFSRRVEIENLRCSIELTVIEHKLIQIITNELSPILDDIEKQLVSVGQRLEALSNDVDVLSSEFFNILDLTNNFSMFCSSTCSLITIKAKQTNSPVSDIQIVQIEQLIDKTNNYYSGILKKLSQARLNPIKQIKSHELSHYTSSTLVAQSELSSILQVFKQQQDLCRIGTIPKGHLNHMSFDLAIEAYNQSCGPYKIAKQPDDFLTIAFNQLPNSTTSLEIRNEWPHFSVRLEAIKMILRSKFHYLLNLERSSLQDNYPSHPADLSLLVNNHILPLIEKFQLTRDDLMRFHDEFSNDPVSLLSDSIEDNLFQLVLSRV